MAEDKGMPDLGSLLPMLLGALEQDEAGGKGTGAEEQTGGIDPAMLSGLLSVAGTLTGDDESVQLLRALRPMLTPERQGRVDDAIRICRLAALLPILKESGLLGKLF